MRDVLLEKSKSGNTLTQKLKKKVENFHFIFLETGDIEIEESARSGHISSGYKCVFSLFNETFILLNNELYSISPGGSTLDLRAFKKLPVKSNIIFAKVR